MGQSKQGRYVYCADCGCRLEMNGICKICGHEDIPLLVGMVPDVTYLTQEGATTLLTHAEAQLVLGTITTEVNETVPVDYVIRSEPIAGTQLAIGSPVNIVISLGPEVP